MDVEASENTRLLPSEEPIAPHARPTSSSAKYLAVLAVVSALALIAFSGPAFFPTAMKMTNFRADLDLSELFTDSAELEGSPNADSSQESMTGAIDLNSEIQGPIDFDSMLPKGLVAAPKKVEEDEESDITAELVAKLSKLDSNPKMMSLAGATTSSQFNECTSKYVKGTFLEIHTPPGCISLYTNNIAESITHLSDVVTFCGCQTIGPKNYDMVSLRKASLISRNGAGQISFIATGDDASVTIYHDPNFLDGYMLVIGPNSRVDLAKSPMGPTTWDNAVYSLIMQSWSDCNLVSAFLRSFKIIMSPLFKNSFV